MNNVVNCPPWPPDASASLENVEILENVRNCHQTQGSQEPKACNTTIKTTSIVRELDEDSDLYYE